MLSNKKLYKAIGLFLIAFPSFLACDKMENETLSSHAMTAGSLIISDNDITAASGVTISTTGIPMIDLGEGCAYGVNSSGKVAGVIWTQPEGSPHAYLWLKNNKGKDLGCLGYPEYSCAFDINNNGQVVGSSWLSGGIGQQRAFLWSDKDGMKDLGAAGDPTSPPENGFSYAFGINNKGAIVGEVDNYGYLWTNKRMMVLLNTKVPLWQWWSTAWDINDNGLIVGTCSPIDNSEEERVFHAKLWTGLGEMLDLGTIMDRQYSVALSINNNGEIVGGCNNVTKNPRERIGEVFDPSNVAFIWTEQNKMSQLPALVAGEAGFASANAINELGQAVGWSNTADGEIHAVVWTIKNGIKDLGKLPGDVESVAYGINNLGQVVGYSRSNNGYPHSVIWNVK
jgi:probable HAF family extracellular repeat protein